MVEIKFLKGDASYPQGPGFKFIVHIVNNIGGWGKGFVLALSRRWPVVSRVYRVRYREFKLGEVMFVTVEPDITIANLFGQEGIRSQGRKHPIRYAAVRKGLKYLAGQLAGYPVSVHMPRIGCGLAGGVWSEIEPIIMETLIAAGIPVFVYDFEPKRVSDRTPVRSYDPATFSHGMDEESRKEWDEMKGSNDES